jgi:hypothetical protein
MSDLGGIGLQDKVNVKFGEKIPIPQEITHPSWWKEPWAKFAIVEVYGSKETPQNEVLAFEKIRKGEFKQDLMELNVEWNRKLIPNVLKFFAPENVKKEALESKDVEEFKSRIHWKASQILFNEWETLVEKYLEGKSEADKTEFFNSAWKSSPKAAKLEIFSFTAIKVFQRVENK